MEETVRRKIDQIDKLAKTDAEYKRMMRKCVVMEQEIERLTMGLTDKQQNLVWGFVMLCEDMSIRKLEIACENMDFTPRIIPFLPKEK